MSSSPGFESTQVDPVLFGSLAAFTLFGISLLQWWYCLNLVRAEAKSQRQTVVFVTLGVLLVEDIADTIVKCIFIHDYMANVVAAGGPKGLEVMPPTILGLAIMSATIASTTHYVYIRRIYKFSHNPQWWLFGILGFAACGSATQYIMATTTGVFAQAPTATWYPHLIPFIATWQSTAAGVDLILCFTFIGYLQYSKSGFAATSDIITKWTRFTLETGMLPAFLQLFDLILFCTFRSTGYHFGIVLLMGKIYLNCVLALMRTVLETRAASRRDGSDRNTPRIGKQGSGGQGGVVISTQIQTTDDAASSYQPPGVDGLNSYPLQLERIVEEKRSFPGTTHSGDGEGEEDLKYHVRT